MKKHLICVLSIILILSLLPINAFAAPKVKTGTITGSVSEAQLRLPLPLEGVSVTVEGTDKSVETNRLGRYTLTKVEEGEVVLLFSKEGYEDIRKTVNLRANRINNVYVTMDKNSSPMVEIIGQVKAKYEVKDVLATIIRIYPDSVPMILELIIPANTPLRDIVISGLLMLDAEKVIDEIDSDILDSVLNNFNPQDLINLIPDLPEEIKQLLRKIVPGSITNEMPLPGTIITVRDGSRVIKVTIADKNGSYKLNIPENCDVEYLLYGFETQSLNALDITDTTYLLTAGGTVRGTVTGEDNEPLEGTEVTVVSAEGKPSGITDAQGNYVITGVKRLLPGFGGGFGGHTVSFDKEDYITARATALFAFGQARADKKLELAPPFGDLDVLVKPKNYFDWISRGGITVKIFENEKVLYSKKLTALDIEDLLSGGSMAKYSLRDLPIGVYRVEFKDNPMCQSSCRTD
ncbi:MAG: hypothetical protein GX046_08865 [Tissierellia bacterium]|nr:hypothetical protein [Tissierellia bacterium]